MPKKYRLLSSIVLALLVLVVSLLQPPTSEIPLSFPISDSYLVTTVVDGDTIKVARGSERLTVRLIGVDTPELNDPRTEVECYAREASTELKSLLTNQTVWLEQDDTQDQVDRYGRTLAYVYLQKDNQVVLVNQYLIEQGFAFEYTYRVPYLKQSEFKQAEAVARMSGRGLWNTAICDYQTTKNPVN